MIHLSRAIWISILVYVASFVVGIIAAYVGNIDLTSASPEMPLTLWFTAIVAGVVLTAIATPWYFRSSKVIANAQTGFAFGIVLIVVSFMCDMILILPALALGQPVEQLFAFYSNPWFWTTVICIVLTATFSGMSTAGKKTGRQDLGGDSDLRE